MISAILPLSAMPAQGGRVGSKALSVARLAAAGLPTPAGWCLTVDAYRAAVSSNSRVAAATRRLGDLDQEDLQEVAGAAEEIRGAILEIPFPVDLQAEIAAALRTLNPGPLAVRSSATSEDLAHAAAAGQHDTHLGVIGIEELLPAIRHCWASLWNARAIVYRARFGGPPVVEMAVLVQELVDADVAGVLFTRNPLNDRPAELLVTSARGPGEQVVSGSADVDTFVVDRTTLSVRETATTSAAASLSSEQLRRVCQAGLDAEAVFGAPQDIEWAFARDKLWLFQARPITTSRGATRSRKLGFVSRLGLRTVVEYFPVPLYHFDASFLPPLIASVSRLASEFGLRGSSAAQIFVEHPDGSLGPGFQAPAPRLSTLFAMLRLPAVLWRTAAVDPLTAMERPRAEILGRATELKRLPMARLYDAAVVQVVRDSQELLARAFEARKAFFLGAWWLTFALDALLRLLHGRRGPEIAADLRAGLSHQTASMNQNLRDLQRMSHTASPAPFAAAVEDFIERYGCRTERPIPVPSARPWADDPDHVRRLLDRFDVPVRRASSRADEHRLFARAYRSSLRRARRWRALRCDRVLPFLVRRNRSLWLERDWTILTYERAVAPARTAMREIGTRLCQRGALRSWSDVRHLSIEEATFALAGAHSPEDTRRRVDHRRAGRRRTVQRWSEAISAATTSRANRGVVLRGTAASPGLATAHASLVLSDRDMDGVRPGDILVCRSTGPSWTPLFGSVAGVVTDLGGPLSHAAIVAREYGIPAVIGTGNATSVLRHDRVYSVDGSAGEVRGGTRSSRGHSQ